MTTTPNTPPLPPLETADVIVPDNTTQAIVLTGDGDNCTIGKVNLPAVPLTEAERKTEIAEKIIADIDRIAESLVGDPARTVLLGEALEIARGYLTAPQIAELIAANLPDTADLSPTLTALNPDKVEARKVWRFQNPFPGNQSELLFATLIGERKFYQWQPNEITTGHSISVADVGDHRYRSYYPAGDSPANFRFPGRRSQLHGRALNIFGSAFAEFPESLTVMFDYALATRQLNNGETIPLLKFGDNEAVIGLNGDIGAFVNIAEFVPNQTTTTTVHKLFRPADTAAPAYRVVLSPARVAAGGYSFEFYFYVPPGLMENTENATIRVKVRFNPGGRDDGTATKEYTLTDWNSLQVLSGRNGALFSQNGNSDLLLRVIYSPIGGLRYNAIQIATIVRTATEYEIAVEYEYTKTVNRSSTTQYLRQPISATDDHDTNRLVNAPRDPELQLDGGTTIMAQFIQGTDGYIHMRVIVNGVAANNGEFINTKRTAENIGIPELKTNSAGNGMFIGDPLVRISRIYGISSKKALTVAQLQQIYQRRATPGLIYYALRPQTSV